jgi:3-methyl-2-oxobutanoate hydroxymethyltransferase
LRRYADLYSVINSAVENYITDVKDQSFPNEEEQY